MLSVDGTTKEVPFQFESLVRGRPDTCQGMPVTWSEAAMPSPVLVRDFSGVGLQGRLFLCGAKFSLKEALIDGEPLGNGFLLEFYVFTEGDDSIWRVARLAQRQSVTYSDLDESKDYVTATKIKNPDQLSAVSPPKWKASEATWPTLGRTPMQFLGQAFLPENPVTRAHLTWGISLFLFYSLQDSPTFKLVRQEADLQTADEYYAGVEALTKMRR